MDSLTAWLGPRIITAALPLTLNTMELTKEYFDQALEGLATKTDLKGFVTKADLEATETRIKDTMATKSDIEELARMVGRSFDEVYRRSDIADLKKQMQEVRQELNLA